jgi:hypothetical protein
LAEVVLPSGLTNIGNSAFGKCSQLTTITIPATVTNLGSYAFEGCVSITSFFFKGDAPSLMNIAVFSGDFSATIFYLPTASKWGPTLAGRPTALWRPCFQATGTGIDSQTNGFGFNILWASGMPVVVEFCTNLSNPAWSALLTNNLNSDASYLNDAGWTNNPSRFYRLRWP